MAKRHQSLVPLARDHHEGLLLAIRLQQGKQALLKLWSHDPAWQAAYVAEFYDKYLHTHFEAEEKGLFPLASTIAACRPVVGELVVEHRALEEYVSRLRHPDKTTLQDDLRSIGALLEEHIRKEDRILFPSFEEHASEEMLEKAEAEIGRFYPPQSS
jgi:hemerythrin-like domain-containing protein